MRKLDKGLYPWSFNDVIDKVDIPFPFFAMTPSCTLFFRTFWTVLRGDLFNISHRKLPGNLASTCHADRITAILQSLVNVC